MVNEGTCEIVTLEDGWTMLTKDGKLSAHFEHTVAVTAEGPRILFAIPWGERTILGTTDTDYAGDLDSPGVDASDVRYILDVANRTFPAAGLTPADVTSTWAGLRPLIADPSGRPSDISRAHQIHMTEPGWLDVAGGKLTTYRLMAEQAVDRVVDFLKFRAAPCATATEPLLPTAGDARFSGVVPPDVSREAVEHYCRHEWAVHLDDVMIRRSGWRHYVDDPAAVERRVLGWMEEIGAAPATAAATAPPGETTAWPLFSRP